MRTDNRLTRAYIESYPADAARSLERLPPEVAAPLLGELDTALGAAMLRRMVSGAAAACLAHCPAARTAALLKALPVAVAARILAAQPPGDMPWPPQLEGLQARPARHPEDTVGHHMQGAGFVLPDDITVAEALRRARRRDVELDCETYVVDRSGALRGQVYAAALLRAAPAEPLRRLVRPAPTALPARTLLDAARTHPAWDTQRRLPVVDERGILLGAVPYKAVRDSAPVVRTEPPGAHAIDTAMEVIGLYWTALAATTDALLSNAGRRNGRDA